MKRDVIIFQETDKFSLITHNGEPNIASSLLIPLPETDETKYLELLGIDCCWITTTSIPSGLTQDL